MNCITVGANTCNLLFPPPITNTLPIESMAILSGLTNCPLPLPLEPHFVIKLPLLSNFSI